MTSIDSLLSTFESQVSQAETLIQNPQQSKQLQKVISQINTTASELQKQLSSGTIPTKLHDMKTKMERLHEAIQGRFGDTVNITALKTLAAKTRSSQAAAPPQAAPTPSAAVFHARLTNYDYRVTNEQEAAQKLVRHVASLKDQGVEGGWLVRASSQAANSGSNWISALSWAVPQSVKSTARNVGEAWGLVTPTSRYTLSLVDQNKDGSYSLTEYEVTVDQAGKGFIYNGKTYPDFESVAKTIHGQTKLSAPLSLSELAALDQQVKNESGALQHDLGFYSRKTFPRIESQAHAFEMLKTLLEENKYPVYLILPGKQTQELTCHIRGKGTTIENETSIYSLAFIDSKGVIKIYSIDLISNQGKYTLKDETGKVLGSYNSISSVLRRCDPELSTPFPLFWNEYQAKLQAEQRAQQEAKREQELQEKRAEHPRPIEPRSLGQGMRIVSQPENLAGPVAATPKASHPPSPAAAKPRVLPTTLSTALPTTLPSGRKLPPGARQVLPPAPRHEPVQPLTPQDEEELARELEKLDLEDKKKEPPSTG